MKPNASKTLTLSQALALSTILWLILQILFVRASTAFATTPPTSCELSGTRVTLLSRVYDQAKDKTDFVYRITQTSPLGLLKKVRFLLPSCPTFKSLVSVDLSGTLLQSKLLPDLNACELTGLNLLGSPRNVKLTMLGNVDLGVLQVDADLLLGGRTSGLIAGPKLSPAAALKLNIDADTCLDLNLPPLPVPDGPQWPPAAGPTPTPQHTPATTPTPTPHGGVQCNILRNVTGLVGQTLRIPVEVLNNGLKPITVKFDQLPIRAILPILNGGSLLSGDKFMIEWTPTDADRNSTQLLRLRVSEDSISATICETEITVSDNSSPVVLVDPVPNPVSCGGTVTSVRLSATRSYDPDGRKLQFTWSTDCESSSIDNPSASDTLLRLGLPGTGLPQACFAYLSVSDGVYSVNASVPIAVLACDTSCEPGQRDVCGVCFGNTACLDCTGIPHGASVIDRCGVCGGSNACLDCAGEVNGGAVRDLCNVCGGDGTSCRVCNTQDLRSVLLSMDGAFLTASITINRGLKPVLSSKARKTAVRLRKEVSSLYETTWKLVWSLSETSLNCSSYLGCTSISSTSSLDTYDDNSRLLRRAARHAASLIARHGGASGKRQVRKFRRTIGEVLLQIEELKTRYPTQVFSCK